MKRLKIRIPFPAIYFTVILFLLIALRIYSACSENAYKKADFVKVYDISNKEFRQLKKSGQITSKMVKYRGNPVYLYEMKADSIKKVKEVKQLNYFRGQ